MASSTIDPLIRLKPSPELAEFARFLAIEATSGDDSDNLPENIGKLMRLKNNEELSEASALLTVKDIRWIYERRDRIREMDNPVFKDLHFHELIKHCAMVLPEPKFPPRNPELEARIQRLKAEQANREYRRMTENVDGRQGISKQSADEPIGKQIKELNNYLLPILQFVISVVCSFVFGYMAPYYIRGVSNSGTRLLSGILCGFVVGVADLYFVVKFMLEAEGLIQTDNIKVYDSQFPQKQTVVSKAAKKVKTS